ncbi:hypothetical protein DYB37_000309 [Aphanomyces astaci]|uniref:Protein RFT1 homolog n=2 Tax=Aphanomyces astaci TaxID=112090 RepID=A0A3R7E5A3_APHAT|nr:hypothetical protein DYB35_000232 [Aphanomyces astaci]RHZ23836.1 hypothetical protein DYB37_000309 [Aphanomyces astaci]
MSVVDKVVSGGGRLLALSFLQRGGTFLMNMLTLRHLPTHVAGVGFSLELVLSTTFIVREGLRLASLREPGIVLTSGKTAPTVGLRQLINTAWLCTGLGWLCTTAAAAFMAPRLYSVDAADFSSFQLTLYLYCISAAVEFLTEPLYILAHSSLIFHLRVHAQGWGFFAKAVVQVVAVLYFDLGMIAFGVSQVAFAIVQGVIYWHYFVLQLSDPSCPLHVGSDLLPHITAGVRPSLLHFWKTLTFQSILKYLLTEGDRLVLSAFETAQQQGEYAIAFNIGSLAPRLVFLPIEDAAKAMFSKLLTSPSSPQSNDTSNAKTDALHMFRLALKCMTLLGLVFVFFATNYARTLLFLLAGYAKTLDNSAPVLSTYCVCVYFLSVNGICEAFVYAVGDEAALQRLNKFLVLFFAITSASAVLLIHTCGLGSVGIVLANCVNMACRVVYCLRYIHRFFKPDSAASWTSLYLASLPHPVVLAAMAVSWVVTYASEVHFRGPNLAHHALHVVIGGVCFAVTALLLWTLDRPFLTQVATLRKQKSS